MRRHPRRIDRWTAGLVSRMVDGKLVGAIGASGGTAQEDEECVSAAVGALGFD